MLARAFVRTDSPCSLTTNVSTHAISYVRSATRKLDTVAGCMLPSMNLVRYHSGVSVLPRVRAAVLADGMLASAFTACWMMGVCVCSWPCPDEPAADAADEPTESMVGVPCTLRLIRLSEPDPSALRACCQSCSLSL